MSLIVMVLVFHVGYGMASVSIEMPDTQTCQREIAAIKSFATYELRYGICVDRSPSRLVP